MGGDATIKCAVGDSSPLTFLIDSGACLNIIAEADWVKLGSEYESGQAYLYGMKETARKAYAYGQREPLRFFRTFGARIATANPSKPRTFAEFYISKEGRRSILSKATSEALGVLKVGENIATIEGAAAMEEFPKVPGVTVKFALRENATPTRNAYFSVPLAQTAKARERLLAMEAQGIIERVYEASDWCSGIRAVKKESGTNENEFRLVINMRGPNRAIKRQYYKLPTMEELQGKLELQKTVAAHNSAVIRAAMQSHEEILMGRKMRRNLPLLETVPAPVRSDFDARDWKIKMRAKRLEDAKRSAREGHFEVGQTVVIMRNNPGKADSRYDPKRFKVKSRIGKNGYELESHDGQATRRNITRIKLAKEEQTNETTTGGDDETDGAAPSKPKRKRTSPVWSPKPQRVRRKPEALRDFVTTVEGEMAREM